MKKILLTTLIILYAPPVFAKCSTLSEARQEYKGKYLTWRYENGKQCWGLYGRSRRSSRSTVRPEITCPVAEPETTGQSATPVQYLRLSFDEYKPSPNCQPEVILVHEPEMWGTDIELASIWPPLEESLNIPMIIAITLSYALSFGLGALAMIRVKVR